MIEPAQRYLWSWYVYMYIIYIYIFMMCFMYVMRLKRNIEVKYQLIMSISYINSTLCIDRMLWFHEVFHALFVSAKMTSEPQPRKSLCFPQAAARTCNRRICWKPLRSLTLSLCLWRWKWWTFHGICNYYTCLVMPCIQKWS